MPRTFLQVTNDCGLLRCLAHFLDQNAALTVMAWVPALFECEDDEASAEWSNLRTLQARW